MRNGLKGSYRGKLNRRQEERERKKKRVEDGLTGNKKRVRRGH